MMKPTAPASEGGRYKRKSNPRRRRKAAPTTAGLGDLKVAATRELEDGAGLGYVGVEFVD
jgi:hypothetical protein